MVGVADGIPELTWLKFGRGAAGASGRSLFQVSEGYSPTSPFLESFNGHPLRRGCRSGHTRVPSLPLLFLIQSGIRPYTRLPSLTRPSSSCSQASWSRRRASESSCAASGHICPVCPCSGRFFSRSDVEVYRVRPVRSALFPERPAQAALGTQ